MLRTHPEFVMAAPGGLVASPATLHILLTNCWTIWLRAQPEDHMNRVIQQGDMRPMVARSEAMEDLRRILQGREAFYAKAD